MTRSAGPPGVFCQVPPGGSGTSTYGPPGLWRRWLTQSWTWNWIQAAARTFSEVAGRKVSRWRSLRLTSTGLGTSKRSGRWTGLRLRPKGAPTAPIPGRERSLYVPS
ncbi:hypothetical protein SALBM135S_04392 [Streptomyces alboniger]